LSANADRILQQVFAEHAQLRLRCFAFRRPHTEYGLFRPFFSLVPTTTVERVERVIIVVLCVAVRCRLRARTRERMHRRAGGCSSIGIDVRIE
jgi:hypothetical protein